MRGREFEVRLKRAYAPAAGSDGARVLVDRLWPRGLSRAQLPLTLWMKEIAPSGELRRFFGHDARRWTEFHRRYREELAHHGSLLEQLRDMAGRDTLTLVYGARDEQHNHARVIREVLLG